MISWAVLGEIELLAAGAALIVAVVAALVVTNWNRPSLDVRRQLNPSLVHEGDRTAVELSITNLRRVPAFNLTVADGVGGLGHCPLCDRPASPARAGGRLLPDRLPAPGGLSGRPGP